MITGPGPWPLNFKTSKKCHKTLFLFLLLALLSCGWNILDLQKQEWASSTLRNVRKRWEAHPWTNDTRKTNLPQMAHQLKSNDNKLTIRSRFRSNDMVLLPWEEKSSYRASCSASESRCSASPDNTQRFSFSRQWVRAVLKVSGGRRSFFFNFSFRLMWSWLGFEVKNQKNPQHGFDVSSSLTWQL